MITDLSLPKTQGDGDAVFRGDYGEKFVPYNLARLMDMKFFFYTDPLTKELLVWDDGIFTKADGFVENVIEHHLRDKTSKNKISETLVCLKHFPRPLIPTENLDLIAVENGFYSINERVLIPFGPFFLNKTKLTVKYDPKADCPNFKKFLTEVVSENDALLLQEIFGYCLWRKYTYHKVFIMLGGGRNGKGTTINILKNMIGSQNTAHISLQQLEEDKFAASRLYGKLANIDADLGSDALAKISMMKSTSGKDEIDGEKKFGTPFAFTNYAKHIMGCNVLPPIYEDTDAVFDRLILIDFPNRFEAGVNEIPDLDEKISTPEEISGVFNWALEGLYRLLASGKFTYSKTSEETRQKYIRGSDPIKWFCITYLEKDVHASVGKSVVYEKYVEMCENDDFKVKNEDTFFKGLKRTYPNVETAQKRLDSGQRIREYTGIKLKGTSAEQLVTEKELDAVKTEVDVIKTQDDTPSITPNDLGST